MSVVVVKTMGLSRRERQPGPADADVRGDRDELRVGLAGATARARSGRSSGCSSRGRSGWSSAGSRSGSGRPGWSPFLVAGAILGSRPRRRPGRRPRAHGPPLATRQARRVLRDLRAGRQGVAGRRPAAVRRDRSSCCSTRSGNGAYQVAVLSLLVTMLIGLWLIWPVRDDWAGSGRGRCRAPRASGAAARTRSPPGAARSSRAEPPAGLRAGSRPGALAPRPGRADHLRRATGAAGVQPRTSPARRR